MRVHITNLYGIGGTTGKAQQMVADIAKRDLHFNELGIYKYPMHWTRQICCAPVWTESLLRWGMGMW